MADEWIKVYGTGHLIRSYTILDAAAVPIYSALALDSTPNTVILTVAGSGALWGGVAIAEKVTLDGSTTIAADIGGQWSVVASGTVPLGHKVVLAGVNRLQSADSSVAALSASGGRIVGTAISTGTNGVRFTVDLDRR